MSEEEVKQVETVPMADHDGRVYEVSFLLTPNTKEEEIPAIFGNMKEMISASGGTVISEEMPKMISLAYPMAKVVSNIRSTYNTAYFGWVKFTALSEEIEAIKKKLDLDPIVIRFLIIKTVRENTMSAKRFVRGDSMARRGLGGKTVKDEGEAVPINKEEIDKEIDAMVAA